MDSHYHRVSLDSDIITDKLSIITPPMLSTVEDLFSLSEKLMFQSRFLELK